MPRFLPIPARALLPACELYTRISTPSDQLASAIDPSYPTVLFLPTLWTDSFFFYPQFDDPVLFEHYNLVAVDARGHGLSRDCDTPGSEQTSLGADQHHERTVYTWEEFGRDAVAVLDVLGVDAFHLIAQSTASLAGCHIAIAHPERVQSVCCVHRPVKREMSAMAGVYPELRAAAEMAMATQDAELLDQITLSVFDFCVGTFQGPATDAFREDFMLFWRSKLASGELTASAHYLYDLLDTRTAIPSAEDMAGVQRPILLLRGTEDGCDPHFEDSDFVQTFNAAEPRPVYPATVYVVDCVPRWMTLASPNIINPILSAHLSSLPPPLVPSTPLSISSATAADTSTSTTHTSPSTPLTPWLPLTPLSPSAPGHAHPRSIARRPSTPRDAGCGGFVIPPPPRLAPGVQTAGEVYDAQAQAQAGVGASGAGSEKDMSGGMGMGTGMGTGMGGVVVETEVIIVVDSE